MSKELEILRKQKMESIKNCDFLQAKAIDAQINQLKGSLTNQRHEVERSQAQIQYSIEVETVRSRASEVYNQFYNELFAIKTNFHKRQTNLQQRHSESSMKISEDYAKELELETIRAIPEADTMKKEAQIRARNGQFDLADNLYHESNDLREKTIKERQDAVHVKYGQLIRQLEEKQQEDFEYLKQKQQQDYTEVMHKYDKEMDKLEKRLQAASINLGVERNYETENKIFKVLEFDGAKSEPNNAIITTPATNKTTKDKLSRTPTPSKTSRTPKLPKSPRAPSNISAQSPNQN